RAFLAFLDLHEDAITDDDEVLLCLAHASFNIAARRERTAENLRLSYVGRLFLDLRLAQDRFADDEDHGSEQERPETHRELAFPERVPGDREPVAPLGPRRAGGLASQRDQHEARERL